MGIRNAGAWLGLVEQDDEPSYDDEHEERALSRSYADLGRLTGRQPRDSAEPAAGLQIATVCPRTFRDAHTIGEYFRQDIPVIINLHELDTSAAKRIVDFASGLIFGRRGDIERLSSRIFLILPPNCTVLKGQHTVPDGGFFNQT